MKLLICTLLLLGGTPLQGEPPAAVDAYLEALHADHPAYLDRLRQVVVDSAGTPYEDGPLGEGPDGRFDDDPLIDLARVDCVTHVEQCAALAAGTSLAGVTDGLQHVRYAGGRIDFASRNHFMIADWIPNNPWCREFTGALGIPAKSVTRTISKADFFRKVGASGIGQDIADREVTLTYIPIEHAEAVAQTLDRPALIVFIGHIDWLFALHCGFFLPDAPGPGPLYHASSKAGKVVSVKLEDYAREQSSRYLGLAVYTIESPELPVSGE